MKQLVLLAALTAAIHAQTTTRFVATTGQQSLVSSATAATLQQPATNGSVVYIDKITIYCSVACAASQATGGTAATSTAGAVTPIQPAAPNTVLPVNFFTSSNVGAGTNQAGIINIPAGSTVPICLSPTCGEAGQVALGVGGSATNYTVSIASITGTVNISFFGRVSQ